MMVLSVRVDLEQFDGRSYFPVEEPIGWDVEANNIAVEIFASFPTVLESMLEAIRAAAERINCSSDEP